MNSEDTDAATRLDFVANDEHVVAAKRRAKDVWEAVALLPPAYHRICEWIMCQLAGTAAVPKGTYKVRLASHGLDPTDPLTVATLTVTLVSEIPAPPQTKVNLLTLSAHADDEGNAVVALTVDHCEALKDYAVNETGGMHSFNAKASVNGGEPVVKTFGGSLGGNSFSGLLNGANAGDDVKVTLEIDPSKTGDYGAGTMEKSTTVTAA